MNNRLREIDFLRGIAILLVFFRHAYLVSYLSKMGWIGVDLFFVLSGFLVATLLFREYQKFGNIDAKLFLIRRGFKIYPIYYLTYGFYLYYKAPIPIDKLKYIAADLLFLQNYAHGYGFAYVASWSLAIEEHFYFSLIIMLSFIFRKKLADKIPQIIVGILILVLIVRLITNIDYNSVFSYTQTHLRIDSLFAGALIAYFYNCKREILEVFQAKYKVILLTFAFGFLLITPFYDYTDFYWFRTIGFTFLYVAFGSILIFILFCKNSNELLNKMFTRPVVDLISKIGYCSYSIYIIHLLVLKVVNFPVNYYLLLFIQLGCTILVGFFMTYYIENYFLAIRDKHFPKRIN